MFEDRLNRKYKVVLAGDSAVGKSLFSWRYQHPESPPTRTFTTIGLEYLQVQKNIDGIDVKVCLWDTAGQERYRSLARLYYSGCLAIIFVYDLTKQDSFNNLKRWMQEAQVASRNWDDIHKIVVANKLDLEKNRQVSYEEAKQELDGQNIELFQVSALTGQNVQHCMESLVAKIHKGQLEWQENNRRQSEPQLMDLLPEEQKSIFTESTLEKTTILKRLKTQNHGQSIKLSIAPEPAVAPKKSCCS